MGRDRPPAGLAFGTPQDVRQAVRRGAAFDDGSGGLIAQCEWANDTPHANIEAVFSTWSEPLIKSENRANRKGRTQTMQRKFGIATSAP